MWCECLITLQLTINDFLHFFLYRTTRLVTTFYCCYQKISLPSYRELLTMNFFVYQGLTLLDGPEFLLTHSLHGGELSLLSFCLSIFVKSKLLVQLSVCVSMYTFEFFFSFIGRKLSSQVTLLQSSFVIRLHYAQVQGTY